MGELALEILGQIEGELALWFEITPDMSLDFHQTKTSEVAAAWAKYAHTKARHDRIDLLTGQKKDEKC